MNTRPHEALPYRDLARQQARISRKIGLDQLPRLLALATGDDGMQLDITLSFNQEANGLIRVGGEVAGSVGLICNGCAEGLIHRLALNFDCVVVDSDEHARDVGERSGGGVDVLVAEGMEITLAEIVEDEILLSLPERLCVTEPCERAPQLDYPAEHAAVAAAEEEAAANSPFSVLAGLKVSTNKSLD